MRGWLSSVTIVLAIWVFPSNRVLADSVQTVRLVSDARLPDGRYVTLLDRVLPASEAFDIEVLAQDPRLVGATIEVWPDQLVSCKRGKPPADGSSQSYRFVMTPSGTGAERVMSARVPPLQIGQPFCLRVTWRAQLDARDVQAFAAQVGHEVIAGLASVGDAQIDNATLMTLLMESQKQALTQLKIDATASAEFAQHFVASESIAALRTSSAKARIAQIELKKRSDQLAVERAKTELLGESALPPAWAVDTGDRLLLLTALGSEVLSPADQNAIIAALRAARGRYSAEERGPIDKWILALQGTGDSQTILDALAKAPALPKPKAIFFVGERGPVSSDDFLVELAKGFDSALLDKALNACRRLAEAGISSAMQTAARAWAQQLESLRDVSDADAQAVTNFTAAAAEQTAAETAIVTDIGTAIAADERLLPRVKLSPAMTAARAGQGTTPAVGSFVTPALGIAATFPIADSSGRAWVFPYFGLNVYFAAVDRTIAIDDLMSDFSQRFSIIAGISLKDVSLPASKAEPALFGGFPYLGLGYRFTNFVQLNAGAALYRYQDANPASNALHWGVAPGIAVAVDLDVVGVATQGWESL